MKSITFALLLILSAKSFAQPVHRIELENRLLRKTSNLNSFVRNNYQNMSMKQLRQGLRKTQAALDAVRGILPAPPPAPAPQPMFIIKAKIEDTSFVLQAAGPRDLMQKCESKVQQLNIGRADDITADISGYLKSRSTAGWWTTRKQKCGTIVSLVLESSFEANLGFSRFGFTLYGEADSYPILAFGDTLEELEASCRQESAVSTRVDEISVHLNSGATKRSSTSGWWTRIDEVCATAISSVF